MENKTPENNNNNNKLSTGKIILIIVLIILIGFGLFGAGCGGFVIFSEIFFGPPYGSFYFISVPSFIVGGLLIFGGYKGIRKILNGRKIVKVLNLCKILKILKNIFNKINNIFNKTNNGENNAENKSKKIDY